MKALISPNELSYSFDGIVLGQRIAEVAINDFPVAHPLFWVDCPNNCVADDWYYLDGNLYLKPISPDNI